MVNKDMLFRLLVEGTRDKMFQKYADLLAEKGVQVTASQLKDIMRKKLTVEAGMSSMSLPSSYFLSGATKLYFNGELTTNKRVALLYPKMNITDKFDYLKCKKLNKIIIDLRNIFIDSEGRQWDVPEDFGDLSLDDIFKKYKRLIKGMDAEAEAETKEPKDLSTDLGDYSFEIIYQHKDAEKYGPYTQPGQWCITMAGNDYWYNRYTQDKKTFFVVFKRKGWENEKRAVGEGYPCDMYGTSLMAVQLKQADGRFHCCTTRWNHGKYDSPNIPNADFAVPKGFFMQTTGCDESKLKEIHAEWVRVSGTIVKPETPKSQEELEMLRKFKYCAIQISNGQNPTLEGHEMFDQIWPVNATNGTGKWNKGMNAACILDNDRYKSWKALMDNGRLKPETLVSGDIETLSHMTYSVLACAQQERENAKPAMERFVILQAEPRSNKFKIYDRIMHRLISVNNKTVFENLYGVSKKTLHLFMKVGTKQYSILDLNTGKTVKSPNGTDVFENMLRFGSSYNNRVKDRDDVNHMIFLVGDSANQECFYYDDKTGRISEFQKSENGKTIVPYIGDDNFKNGDMFIAARHPVPNDRETRGSFDNGTRGTYVYSKTLGTEIQIPGFDDILSHTAENGVNIFWVRKKMSDGTPNRDGYVALLGETGKLFRLPDGKCDFYAIEVNPSFNKKDDMIMATIESDPRIHWYNKKYAVGRISDGKTLTKNGFSDSEYDVVKKVKSVSNDNRQGRFVVMVEFADGDTKFYSPEDGSFMRLENGEDTCYYAWCGNHGVSFKTNGGKFEYDTIDKFLDSLTPEGPMNENFNRLANYKLKLL